MREYIKREIVHRLCISPATHSQVVKALPNRLTKAEGEEKSYLGAVDGILKEVAVFYRPGTHPFLSLFLSSYYLALISS
jgi:hypothetical protein